MKKAVFFLLLGLVAITAMAQNTVVNDKDAVVRKVGEFNGVAVADGIDLYINQGSTEGVAISASNDKYRSNIKTEVANGILKIFYDDAGTHVHVYLNNRRLKAYVTVKNIKELHASGGSNVYVEGSLQGSKLDLEFDGGSNFHGQVQASDVAINASGGANVTISGKAEKLKVETSGGSNFKGYDLIADVCDVDVSGGGESYVTANKEINASASGGANITYKGSGLIKTSDASGGSHIRKG